ncbi:hemin-degrading factor [Rhodoferax koreense]|uniref:Hemin-degrading factor n=1 Tax=Rhodoferax koreensis TaxID=1842727 RepID=A0A1P8K0A1_9BURK|nr:ChuX/HutX family heme-like substrate-binding protein [Rhodoferax koreense]APW39427.1 hemin-degrading factor [Rhodoferax koreense]
MQQITDSAVRQQFADARASGKRAKDAAESLGLSEGAAVAAHVGAHAHPLKAIRLQGPWIALLQGLQACGPVMALTRNASTVHEKTGVYENISGGPAMGLALGEDIDLRLFLDHWFAGFAVFEPAASSANPPAQSLQFFDAHGVAVHKIFVRDATDRAAFDALVARVAQPAGGPVVFTPATPKAAAQPDDRIDVAALSAAWGAMTDTHQFFGLLRQHKAERQQALRLVEGEFTQRADPSAVRHLLDEAAMDGTPIMVFVGSPGCIQIHSGPVHRIEPMVTPTAQWINVLDPGFNLHLREDMIADVWTVQKPTADGIVTSVEAFDHSGELMAMFFGSRKPGTPELQGWRDIVARLPLRETAVAS